MARLTVKDMCDARGRHQFAMLWMETPGDNFVEIGGTDDFLRWAFTLHKHGADGFYRSGYVATVSRHPIQRPCGQG